jgi:hypothetical protein
MKARLFLSYARLDGSDACERFYDVLDNLGHEVYRDQTDNYGGDYWEEKIKAKIRSADAFLLFVTPAALTSANVTREWQEALALRKRIVPLLLSDVPVPAALQGYEFSDIRTAQGREIEPSRIHKGLEAEHTTLKDRLDQIRSALADITDANARQYLKPLLDAIALLLAAEPSTLPVEVLTTMCDLAQALVAEAAAGKDIGPLLHTMINGEFETANENTRSVYGTWLEAVARPLKKVRDAMPRISVPVVIVAMTDSEAKELESGAAFNTWPSVLKDEFTSVAGKLDATWTERYGATSEDWRPFGEKTVAQLIRDAFALVQGCRAPLDPLFIDIRSLRKNRTLLNKVRRQQCLVVIDCVSCRHPALYSHFRASHLDVSPRSIVVRTLLDPSLKAPSENVEILVHEWLASEFYQRHYEDDDPQCADVTTWDGFRKLLRNEIPRGLPECVSPGSDRWNAMNNVGRSVP